MRAADLTLGMAVHASDTLYRESKPVPGRPAIRKTWIRYGERTAGEGFIVNNPGARPVTGIVVGIRTLNESGESTWRYGSDEPTTWRTNTHRTAVLIATSLRTAPIYAWPEDLTKQEGTGHEDH